MRLDQLQLELGCWQEHNFPGRPSYYSLLGAVEELGELACAHLKEEQGIRTEVDHEAEAKDAVGDCVIFLADYCNARGWSLQAIVQETWQKVKKRDWKKDPQHGGQREKANDEGPQAPCPRCGSTTVTFYSCPASGSVTGARCAECGWTYPECLGVHPSLDREEDGDDSGAVSCDAEP